MPAFSAKDLSKWCGGTWRPSEPSAINGVCTDTRSLKPASLYVALRGPRHDGHDFVPQALTLGAAAAVVTDAYAAAHPPSAPLLCVRDTLKALGDIARGYRDALKAKIVAVTGSVGKTTVKEMIADVLARKGATTRSRGNWNNDIGLPLSMLAMEPGEEFGVFELGMNHPGELAPLCDMLRPDWGVVTNVGPVHLEFFDSVEAIGKEKATVLQRLPADGTAVVSRDEPLFELLRASARCRVLTTSLGGARADYEARLGNHPGVFTVFERAGGETAEFEVPLPGEHVVRDALFAVAVGRGHGVAWGEIAEALRNYRPPPMRWTETLIGGVAVINDAYNANPMSMRAALKAFEETPVEGGRWLVFGGMRELGAAERDEHLALGRDVAGGNWAGLVTVGKVGRLIADGAEAAGFAADRLFRCEDHANAVEQLSQRVVDGDAVLLKASRGEELEKVLEIWRQQA